MRGPVRPTLSTAVVVWLALAAAACNGGGTQPGDPCDAKRHCDDGQICDLTDPEGAVCLDGSGDVDGDGILNGKDFCAHVAGGAYDEDGDRIGDDCDACPIGPPPEVAESDGDGVDSPCDPDPRTPGDKIALFEGFNAPLSTAWTATPGWQAVGGAVVVTPATADTERLTLHLALPSVHMAMLASYRIDRVTPAALVADAGVVAVDTRPAGTSVIVCGGSRSGSGDLLRLDTDTASASKAFADLFNPASLYLVAQQLDGATANCALVSGPQSAAVQAGTSGNLMTQAGLAARGATARFNYFLVVQR